jgi:hypothetical protein
MNNNKSKKIIKMIIKTRKKIKVDKDLVKHLVKTKSRKKKGKKLK